MAVNLFQRNDGSSEEIPEGTTFSSDEIVTDEESGVDLVEDVGSVTRTREGDPLAGSGGPLEQFRRFATRSEELPQSVQIPAQPESEVAEEDQVLIPTVEDPQAGTVTRVETSSGPDGGGSSINEPASAVGESVADAIGGSASALSTAARNLDILAKAAVALAVIVALGQLFDFGIDLGEVGA